MAVIIDNGQAHTVIVERRNTVATERSAATPVLVSSPGPQGPAGIPGASGDGSYPAFDFAFGDASPAVRLTLAAGTQEVITVSLQVEEAFDGAGATVALGTAANPELLLPFGASDLATEATYDVTPREELAGGTQLVLTVNAGAGASQGRGQIVIQTTPVA